MIARERLIEIGVSVTGVGIMVALLYVIGLRYTDEASNGHQVLSSSGGEMVVYAIIAFILLMAAAGLVLTYTVTVVEAENDDSSDSSNA